MKRNTDFSPEQASLLDGLPGIKTELREGRQEIIVDRCVLPAYCQFELIKTVLETLESLPSDDEKQQELIVALRAYLTSTEKPLDVQVAKDWGATIGLYLGMAVWLYGAFLVCGYSTFVTQVFNFCKEKAVYSIFALPLTIGIAVMAVISLCIPAAVLGLLGSAIGWGIATGINNIHTHRHTVKTEKRLNNLMNEINLLLETESKESKHVAGCSKSGFFSAKENNLAATLGESRTRAHFRPISFSF